jgi:hypothetical protein
MATMAQKQRVDEIREYFRTNYLGRITNVRDAKSDIQNRFRLDNAEWHRRRRDFLKMMAEHKGGPIATVPAQQENTQDGPAEIELTIPSNLSDEAKLAFARLMTENLRLSKDLAQAAAAATAHVAETTKARKRVDLLKNIVGQVLDTI